MGIQGTIKNIVSPKQQVGRMEYAHLGSKSAHKINQPDATPANIRPVGNPHTGKPLTKYPRCTEAQAKLAERKADIIEKRSANGKRFMDAKTRIETTESNEHKALTDYRIGRLDREHSEQQSNAKLAQHASELIPQQEMLRRETNAARNQAVADVEHIAREFEAVIGY